jgi:hypothetical protein
MQEAIVLGCDNLPHTLLRKYFEDGSIRISSDVYGISTCPKCGARGQRCECGVEKKWEDRKTGRPIIMKNIELI